MRTLNIAVVFLPVLFASACKGPDSPNETPRNSAPVIDSVKVSQPFTWWGDQVTVTCFAHDNDGNAISYVWQALDGGTIHGSGRTITLTVPQDTSVTHRVQVIVSDNFSVGSKEVATIESARLVFSENFDSSAIGTFPSSRGWSLLYSGSGVSYQYVDNTLSASGTQSLHMVGSYCWSANAFHTVTLPIRARLEAMLYLDQIVSCGCTQILAHLEFANPNLGTWGTPFGMVQFNCDGKVYANQGSSAQEVFLMSYAARTWYRVKIDVDLAGRTFDIFIDNILRGSSLRISDSGMPTGVDLSAGHGGNPTAWFDDVRVWTQ